ncbi:tetraacyldisaccharide 4'-kinase [Diaphorobacter aerolatus]|uniref:Tetraacyldisaccharide 4'-kinase n=1 Tax=Diaphorobacter aerolatus TaxID=1288495 RepID=A0A7H0GKA8_9BURK|nr:tetraacyldisaccharide 4'-kinase [Diaphorobacter aerolatus]QNP48724.1 tetraacyldisaccharide 4'-kinase [Diaphorobacter aerolatus]
MAGNASSALRQSWQRRGALACLLWPVSKLYAALTALRRMLYRSGHLASTRLPVPVITVGNVIAGGAGKTPVTMAVVRHLQSRGFRPGVVSRGYGRQTADCRAVTEKSTPNEVGDEPLLLARALDVPVFVARQRADAAKALLVEHPEVNVIVCDDGLQHLALQRDIEICVFNDEGIGNGWLLPAGPLREPWPRKVDLVLHAGHAPGGAAPQFALSRELAEHAVTAQGVRVPLDSLRGQDVNALAAIARPEEFFAMLRARGLKLARTFALPDHADLTHWQAAGDASLPLLCTEKDAIKLWRTVPDALAVPLQVHLPAAFFDALDGLLRRYHPPLAQ